MLVSNGDDGCPISEQLLFGCRCEQTRAAHTAVGPVGRGKVDAGGFLLSPKPLGKGRFSNRRDVRGTGSSLGGRRSRCIARSRNYHPPPPPLGPSLKIAISASPSIAADDDDDAAGEGKLEAAG